MNSKSGRSQIIKHNYKKIYMLTAALCLVVALAISLTVLHFGDYKKEDVPKEPTQTTDEPTETRTVTETEPAVSTETEETTETPVGTIDRIDKTPADMVAGNPLVLVNGAHPYTGKTPTLVDMYKEKKETDEMSLSLVRSSMYLAPEAMDALKELDVRLRTAYPDFKLLITSACETVNKDISCPDGVVNESEHATGYSVDGRFIKTIEELDEKGNKKTVAIQFYDVAGANQTAFLLEEGAKLGLIQSKANLAEHKNEDLRHLRYVGVPHAQYIFENKLTLEGYLDLLKGYNFNSRLQIPGENGTRYEIYFVRAEGDVTKVPVPSGSDYKISGNGADGFIVTLTISA